jgi:hypothetical protein
MLKIPATLVGAAALVAIAGPALAGVTPPYGVSVGGSSTAADHAYTAHSSSITFTVHSNVGPQVMTCTDVTVAGNVHAGPSGENPIASITSSTWNDCKFNSNDVSVSQNGTWNVTGTGTATSGTTDNVAGNITGADANVSFATCGFEVTGSAAGTFDEANQQIDVNETGGHLSIASAGIGCFGILSAGNTADFVGNFTITSPDGAINVF